ncbi:MAG: lipid-A-disaccharide synthase [Pseudomonadota bacterium]
MCALRVALVAAEPSGDVLGERLIAALRSHYPHWQFEGVGGPGMLAHGLRSLAPMETLSVMGLFEVLRHLPELLRLRRDLIKHWLAQPPDLFIGIDAPDFNLPLARQLRQAGIPTVHYVCPSVWAWRPGRVHKIRSAVDLLLSLFPFEPAFLQQHGVTSCYVGHTLAQKLPLRPDQTTARQTLALAPEPPVLALLPGSRPGEVSRLAPSFLATARACRQQMPELQLVAPMANAAMAALWQVHCAQYAPDLPIKTILADSQAVLTAADTALVASGTATLEALLCNCPMVVGYRLHALTYAVLRALNWVNTERVVLANLLAEEPLAPLFLQQQCAADYLAPAVLHFLQSPEQVATIRQRYRAVHQHMRVDTDARIVAAIFELLRTRGVLCR